MAKSYSPTRISQLTYGRSFGLAYATVQFSVHIPLTKTQKQHRKLLFDFTQADAIINSWTKKTKVIHGTK